MRLSIILPTFNEEKIIRQTIINLEKFVEKYLDKTEIIITDGCSEDDTIKIVKEMQKRFSNIELIESKKRVGKGNDIEKAIKKSKNPFCVFVDADLSVDLSYILKLLSNLENGYDLVIGSRLIKGSVTDNRVFRNFLSSCYSLFIRILFAVPIKDYQCGFKGFNRSKILPILKEIKNKGWFWDTEVLIRSYKRGLKMKEIPIRWRETRKSRINVYKVSFTLFVSAIRLKLNI